MFKIIHMNSKGRIVTDLDLDCVEFEDTLETNNMLVRYLEIAQFDPGDKITVVEAKD